MEGGSIQQTRMLHKTKPRFVSPSRSTFWPNVLAYVLKKLPGNRSPEINPLMTYTNCENLYSLQTIKAIEKVWECCPSGSRLARDEDIEETGDAEGDWRGTRTSRSGGLP
ncbi:hypothetical protein LguiB_004252 [Lonicera macranthoides]